MRQLLQESMHPKMGGLWGCPYLLGKGINLGTCGGPAPTGCFHRRQNEQINLVSASRTCFQPWESCKSGAGCSLLRKGVCWGASGSKANSTQDSLGPKGKSPKVGTEGSPCLLNPGLAAIPWPLSKDTESH